MKVPQRIYSVIVQNVVMMVRLKNGPCRAADRRRCWLVWTLRFRIGQERDVYLQAIARRAYSEIL